MQIRCFWSIVAFVVLNLSHSLKASPPSYHYTPPTPEEAASQKRFATAVTAGEGLLKDKKWTEAAAMFSAAIREDKLDGQAHYGLARAQFALGKVKEAVENYRFLYVPHFTEAGNGIGLTVSEPDAHFNYAIALARAGQGDEAIAVYHEGLRRLSVGRGNGEAIPLTLIFPSNEPMTGLMSNYSPAKLEAAAHLAIGITKYLSCEDEGFAQIQQAVTLQPNWALAHFYLGLSYRHSHYTSTEQRLKNKANSEAEFEKALSSGGLDIRAAVEEVRKEGLVAKPKWPTDPNNIRNQKPTNLSDRDGSGVGK